MKNEEYDDVLEPLSAHLTELFNFVESEIEIGIAIEEDGYKVDMADFFMISLTKGYEKLISLCPKQIEATWKFQSIH